MNSHEEHEHEKALGSILKKYGVVRPSERFSAELSDRIVSAYGKKPEVSPGLVSTPWVARIVVGIALVWVALFLYLLGPFAIQQIFSISILSFTVGLWALILLIRKRDMST
jgi:hypothetical protein